ncbi:MAG: GNAT family N-acetyltransferase [Pseudomonadota bacterium]
MTVNIDSAQTTSEITTLPVRDPHIARQLHSLMQAAYKVEAQLVRDDDFPPLRRTLQKLSLSQSRFIGIRDDGHLHAAIELVALRDEVYIDALVVAPAQFRKGHGIRLLQHAINLYPNKTFIVQTGKANIPAVRLYQKAGFAIEAETTTPTGLELVSLVRESRS